MAPRKDECGADGLTSGDTPRSPTSFAKCLDKSPSSFDSLDLTNSSASITDSSELRDSFLHLSMKGSHLLDEVNSRLKLSAFSPTLDACKNSLHSDASSLLNESKVLVDNLEKEGSLITPWRASLAQIRVDLFLATIKCAMQHPSRERLDMELLSIADFISGQARDEEMKRVPVVTISSWKSPSLAFNVVVGPQITYNCEGSDDHFPLKLKITAIAEVLANDIDKGTVGSYQACIVGVEKCNHESRSFCATGTGIVGDCLVSVRLSPVGTKKSADTPWGIGKEVGYLHVKEART
jgi:hypothetical protein